MLVVLGEIARRGIGEVEIAVDGVADGDGNPEESRHRRMPLREAHRAVVSGDRVEADRPGVVDQGTEQAVPLRQMADPVGGLLCHPDVDELLQPTALGDHPESTVAGADEFHRCLHNRAENRWQFQVRDDRSIGLDKRAEPPLGLQDFSGLFDQFSEGAVEFGARHVGESDGVLIVHAEPSRCRPPRS